MTTIPAARDRLRAAADGRLAEICRRYDVDLLTVVGSAVAGGDPRDLDVAVRFARGRWHRTCWACSTPCRCSPTRRRST